MKRVNTELIQERMTQKKITLQEMAEFLGYKNASSMHKYLNGAYQFRAHHVPVLLEKLSITMEELFFEDKIADSAKSLQRKRKRRVTSA